MSLSTSPETWQVIPLDLLAPGQMASIDSLHGELELVHRLEEMGLRSGENVEMIQAGSPCIIRLAGCKLCFRESELLNVLVRLGDAA